MNEDQETLSLFDNSRKAEKLIITLCGLIGINPNGKNVAGAAESKLAGERKKYEQSLEIERQYKDEICRLVGAKDLTAAKKRIAAVFAKLGKSAKVSDQYSLDTSFIMKGIGRAWDRTPEGNDQYEMIKSLDKKIAHQRTIYEDTYNKFLDQVVIRCHEESLEESSTRSEVERWHSAMKEDFDLLTVPQFWQKYCGDLHDISVMPNEPQTILLYDALPLIKKYAPIQVYQEMYDDDPERLGYIPRYKFTSWESRAVQAKEMNHDNAMKEMYSLSAEILTEASFRRIEGPEAILSPGEKETTLRFILTHEEINPYGREFSVDDNTSFLEIQQLYLQYSGAGK